MAANVYLEVLSDSSSENENRFRRRRRRRRRIFRERINFGLQIDEFQEKFRISPAAAEYVLSLIGEDLAYETFRNHALSPEKQLLTTLHFLGNGAQYHGVGDMHGVSKSTVCRVVHKVASVIIRRLFFQKVRWPTDNIDSIQLKFLEIAGFPRVARVVDGTLIPMDAPTINEAAYVDRKGSHSLNAMVVCGPDLQFFYASAKWPGSVHDSRVLRNSTLYEKWEHQGTLNYRKIIVLVFCNKLIRILIFRLATISECNFIGRFGLQGLSLATYSGP